MTLGTAFALQITCVGAQVQKTVLHLLRRMRGHKRALALTAHHQILGSQLINRLAHRALADLEAASQLHLTGNQLAGTPFTHFQTLQDQALDLLIQGAERWSGNASCAMVAGVVIWSGVVKNGHGGLEGFASGVQCTKMQAGNEAAKPQSYLI